MKKIASLLCLTILLGLMVGCSPLEKQAYNVIVAAKAFLDAEKKLHPECTPGSSVSMCANLEHATAAKDSLIDAAEIYCSGPQFEAGGACEPPAKGTLAYDQASAKLKAAIAGYAQAEKDVRASF